MAGQGTWARLLAGHMMMWPKNQRTDYKFTNWPLYHILQSSFVPFLTIAGEENPQPIKYRVCVRHRNICEN